jgi:hypothetical protein
MAKTIRRLALVFGLCALLSPIAAWGNSIDLTNESGSVTISIFGMLSGESELTGYRFNWRNAPPGHDLGSLSFSTGPLVVGTLLGGGAFSSAGSSFIATGFGQYRVPNGVIFTGSFYGPIEWTLLSHTGDQYIFALTGNLHGMAFTGRSMYGSTDQTIYLTQNQQGGIQSGRSGVGGALRVGAEPTTFLLFSTGLAFIVGAVRGKLLSS